MNHGNIIADLSFQFAVEVFKICRHLNDKKEFLLSKQLLRSATSIGANIEEASAGQTKKDFIAKMCIASKEARETRYWLRLLKATQTADLDYTPLLDKIETIIKILTKIVKTAQSSMH
jgi:four helix bundle protein